MVTHYTVTIRSNDGAEEAYWVISDCRDGAARQARRFAGPGHIVKIEESSSPIRKSSRPWEFNPANV
jgi:hypothetical protein